MTNIPLRVIHTEPSEPTITTDEPPPAYDFHRGASEFDRRNEYDRRNGYERREDSYNGKTAHDMAYDEESLVNGIKF